MAGFRRVEQDQQAHPMLRPQELQCHLEGQGTLAATPAGVVDAGRLCRPYGLYEARNEEVASPSAAAR